MDIYCTILDTLSSYMSFIFVHERKVQRKFNDFPPPRRVICVYRDRRPIFCKLSPSSPATTTGGSTASTSTQPAEWRSARRGTRRVDRPLGSDEGEGRGEGESSHRGRAKRAAAAATLALLPLILPKPRNEILGIFISKSPFITLAESLGDVVGCASCFVQQSGKQ